MLVVSVILFCLVGAGLVGMGLKYITTTPPTDYHAEILSGATISDEVRLILGVLYKVMGGAFAGLGIGTALIALTGVWNDLLMAKLTVLAMVLVSGGFAVSAPKAVEDQTRVKTPWRIAAALLGVSVLAFALSLF